MCTAACAPPPLSSYACISCLVCCLRAFFRARSPPRAPPLLLLHVPPIFPVCPVFCGDCIASVSCLLFPGLLIIKEGFSGPNNSNAPIIIINNNNNNNKKQSKQRYRMSPFFAPNHLYTVCVCCRTSDPFICCVRECHRPPPPPLACRLVSLFLVRSAAVYFIIVLLFRVCFVYVCLFATHTQPPNPQPSKPYFQIFRLDCRRKRFGMSLHFAPIYLLCVPDDPFAFFSLCTYMYTHTHTLYILACISCCPTFPLWIRTSLCPEYGNEKMPL